MSYWNAQVENTEIRIQGALSPSSDTLNLFMTLVMSVSVLETITSPSPSLGCSQLPEVGHHVFSKMILPPSMVPLQNEQETHPNDCAASVVAYSTAKHISAPTKTGSTLQNWEELQGARTTQLMLPYDTV